MTGASEVSRRGLITGAAAGAALAAGGLAAAAPANAVAPRGVGSAHRYRTRVVLLGTAGGPRWVDATGRAGISTAVVVDNRFYLVDAGYGVAVQVRSAGLGGSGALRSLRGIFLTHLHSDHVGSLSDIITAGSYNGLDGVPKPVPIWGPGNRRALPPVYDAASEPPVVSPENPTPGTREMVELLVKAFATDYNDRSRDSGQPVPADMFEGRDVPIPDEYSSDPNAAWVPRMSPIVFHEDDLVRVSATLVQHPPVFPALAYRFDTADGSIVISGDTAPSDNLVELATGADVLVHEVMDRGWAESRYPAPRTPVDQAHLDHLLRAHTVIEDVGPIAERAGVGTLVLSHLVPKDGPEHVFRRAQEGFSGRLVVGRDLDEIGVGVSA